MMVPSAMTSGSIESRLTRFKNRDGEMIHEVIVRSESGTIVVPGGHTAIRFLVCLLRSGWLGSAEVRPIPEPVRYGPKRRSS